MKPTQSIRGDVRRRAGSCADFDFDRARAVAHRGSAMRDAATLRAACAGIVAMAGLLAAVFLGAAVVAHAPNGHAAAAQISAAPIR